MYTKKSEAQTLRELTSQEIEHVSGGSWKGVGGAIGGGYIGYQFGKDIGASRGRTAYFTVVGAGLGGMAASSS